MFGFQQHGGQQQEKVGPDVRVEFRCTLEDLYNGEVVSVRGTGLLACCYYLLLLLLWSWVCAIYLWAYCWLVCLWVGETEPVLVDKFCAFCV